jgi:DNA uptake protein ComE-like DNA-binding protein
MRCARWLERAWQAVRARLASALAALTYRRQELVVVGLLAGSLLGGLAIEAWHRRAPALLDRLESEPSRVAVVAGPARARAPAPLALPAPRPSHPRRSPGAGREARGERQSPGTAPPSSERPVDLDHATVDDLTRLPGIGPRLAARILARRDDLGGRFPSFDDFASVPGLGARRARHLRPLIHVAGEASRERPAPDLAGTPP